MRESDPFVVFREAFGFVPNLLRAQGALPRLVAAHTKLEKAVGLRDGAISRIHKERIHFSIAADRRDNYWVTLGAELLASLGVPESHIDNLLSDYEQAGLSASELALLEFCLKLSRDSTSASLEDVEVLRARGFGDEAIIEVVVLAALALYRCTLSAALRPEPDFKPRKVALKTIRGAGEAVAPTTPPDTRRRAVRRGPYVSRSILKFK